MSGLTKRQRRELETAVRHVGRAMKALLDSGYAPWLQCPGDWGTFAESEPAVSGRIAPESTPDQAGSTGTEDHTDGGTT